MLEPLPDSFVATRDGMHALAEHVLAPARYRSDGHIGLTPAPGGFGTPIFGDGERIRVDGVELVHEHPGTSTRVRISTIGAAAQFVGIEPGAVADVYPPATPCTPDAPLALDGDAARVLAAWIALAETLLEDLRAAYAAHESTTPTIWPEHFDLACEFGNADAGTRGNYGASPGDSAIAEPYLYVGPWDASLRTGKLAEHPWGAAITYGELQSGGDAKGAGTDFFREGAALILGQP